MPAILDALIENFDGEVTGWFDQMQAGKMPPWLFERKLARRLRPYMQAAYMAGSGETKATRSILKRIDSAVKVQRDFLGKFTDAIRDGIKGKTPNWPVWKNRALLYTKSLKQVYWWAKTGGIELPAYPGDGSSSCLNRCGCDWTIRWIDKDTGYAHAWWKRHKDDSCKECVEREAAWNPLVIKDWKPEPGYPEIHKETNNLVTLPTLENFKAIFATKGGPGSGHWGHVGIPGKRGGSARDTQTPFERKRRATTHQTTEHDPMLYSKINQWQDGLNEDEQRAVFQWTNSSRLIRATQSGEIYDLVKSGKVTVHESEIAAYHEKAWETAISRAPDYKGEAYRGLSGVPSDTVYDWIQSGELGIKSDQSASGTKANAQDFQGYQQGVMWQVKTKTSKAIYQEVPYGDSGDQQFKNEHEVIMRKGQKYRVEGAKVKTGEGRYTPFNEWLADSIAERLSWEAERIYRRIYGADKYVQGMYGPAYIKKVETLISGPKGKKAGAAAVKFYQKKKAILLKQIKAGKWPKRELWPKGIPTVILDLVEL